MFWLWGFVCWLVASEMVYNQWNSLILHQFCFPNFSSELLFFSLCLVHADALTFLYTFWKISSSLCFMFVYLFFFACIEDKRYSGSTSGSRYDSTSPFLSFFLYFALAKSNSSSFTGGERLPILVLWILNGVLPLRHTTGGT